MSPAIVRCEKNQGIICNAVTFITVTVGVFQGIEQSSQNRIHSCDETSQVSLLGILSFKMFDCGFF